MINFKWVSHLKDTEAKQKFEEAVRADVYVLSRLDVILDEMLEEIEREEFSVAQFERPNWQYQIAFRLGDKSRIEKLKTLLSHLNE